VDELGLAVSDADEGVEFIPDDEFDQIVGLVAEQWAKLLERLGET
jgi:hypothetical protein